MELQPSFATTPQVSFSLVMQILRRDFLHYLVSHLFIQSPRVYILMTLSDANSDRCPPPKYAVLVVQMVAAFLFFLVVWFAGGLSPRNYFMPRASNCDFTTDS